VKTPSESIRCVNGCGNLTIDKHEKLTKRERISRILMGFTLIIITVIFTGLALGFFSSQYYYVCDNGEEIPAYWENDGEEDCSDGSDENESFLPLEVYLFVIILMIAISFLLILDGIIGGNAIEYFYCDKCGGKLLDSKTLRTKLGWDHEKALTIENLLEDCDYGERECPTCEAKMKVLDLGYKKDIDIHPLLPTMTGKRNIELDGCIECSHIWFDKSEFSKILGEAKTKSLKLN
jgi:Zn-finger nucleic acid-binding protein